MSQLRVPVDPQSDHIAGPVDAAVQLVEYGDFECPYCAAAYPEVKKLRAALGDQLCFVFRHFPLSEVHPHALQAAEAAEAAGAQERFWEMHDLLFEHASALELPSLMGYAQALDLDLIQFAEDMEQHRFLPRIRRDFIGGVRSGVNRTPTFFINGVRHDGAYTFAELLAAIRGAPYAYAF